MSQSTNRDSRMKCDQKFIETIPQIFSTDDLCLLRNRLCDHLNSELNNTEFDEFIQMCLSIKHLTIHESDTYTLRRVIVGFDSHTNHNSHYDLKNITNGMITSSPRMYQSWTMKKSPSWILKDRYESTARNHSQTIMYMIEKKFRKEDIVMHIPSLVCALDYYGFKDIDDQLFIPNEEEVIVESTSEVEYDNLWFFTMRKKSYKSILYEKTSEVLKIPLVEGGYSESNIIYF